MWNAESFSSLLQMSMLPVVLISAASLLLLSVTNRLGRTVDRSRGIAREMEAGAPEKGREQLRILVRRSELLRACASFVALSILFSSLMILGLFLFFFAGWATPVFVLAVFFLSVLSLIASLVFFMADIFAALKALKLDVSPYVS